MTLFILRKNGNLIAGPREWDRAALSRLIKTVSLPVNGPAEAVTFGQFELKPVADKPAHNPLYQTCTWDDANEEWDVSYRSLAALKAIRLKEARAYTEQQILETAPAYAQRNGALGLLGAGVTAAMKTFIDNWRTACQDHQNAINALTTQADVANYDLTTGWPE